MNNAGHNSNAVDAGRLLAFIERIETLEENKREISGDIKEIYDESKGAGYDNKIIRKIVAMRRVDADKRREEQEILGLYLSALGMLADTPLGQFAVMASGVLRGGGA